jgi:hypothetical protein
LLLVLVGALLFWAYSDMARIISASDAVQRSWFGLRDSASLLVRDWVHAINARFGSTPPPPIFAVQQTPTGWVFTIQQNPGTQWFATPIHLQPKQAVFLESPQPFYLSGTAFDSGVFTNIGGGKLCGSALTQTDIYHGPGGEVPIVRKADGCLLTLLDNTPIWVQTPRHDFTPDTFLSPFPIFPTVIKASEAIVVPASQPPVAATETLPSPQEPTPQSSVAASSTPEAPYEPLKVNQTQPVLPDALVKQIGQETFHDTVRKIDGWYDTRLPYVPGCRYDIQRADGSIGKYELTVGHIIQWYDAGFNNRQSVDSSESGTIKLRINDESPFSWMVIEISRRQPSVGACYAPIFAQIPDGLTICDVPIIQLGDDTPPFRRGLNTVAPLFGAQPIRPRPRVSRLAVCENAGNQQLPRGEPAATTPDNRVGDGQWHHFGERPGR